MIPVELRLTNFLSYGTAAPPLDFEQFHVACLSGRNGQGKSALLDAITWALWGEARKSSGSHKPDEELLRIGARRMQVDLVFDIEGERYRVTRAYARSATGKTSRSELEFNVYEPTSGDYRPLTGASVRETQEHLDRLLGIDYDTFINSAFLLQGRSDEFTKKKPSDRKQILARILNLGRYDRLAELARDREREAAERLQQADLEIERLKAALEHEPQWRLERAEVEERIAAEQERLDALRREETCLAERLAHIDAKAREVAHLEQALQGLLQRIRQGEQDVQGLRARIAEADTLIALRQEIERDYERYEAFLREREDLDTKNHLYRGIEKQIDAREAELRERRAEMEKRVHMLEVELKAGRTGLQEYEVQLADEPAVRRKLARAQEAQQELLRQSRVLEERKECEEQVRTLERELVGQREALNGELAALEEQIRQVTERLQALPSLEEELGNLQERLTRRQALEKEREETLARGQELAETIRERAGQLSAREQALAEQHENFARFRSAADGICPTCGTELTPVHRREVEDHYRLTLRVLESEIADTKAWIAEQEGERDRLRAAYRSLQVQLEAFEALPEQIAKVEEQIRAFREEAGRQEQRRAEAEALRRRIEGKQYGLDERRRWRALRERLEGLAFDPEAYEQLREEAAQVARYEEGLRQLEAVRGRADETERRVRQQEQQLAGLRRQLDDGTLLGPLQLQIQGLKAQLQAIGFSPARLEEVRQSIKELAQAGARMKDLMHAQQNQLDWKEQLQRLQQQLGLAAEERERLTVSLDGARAELRDRALLEQAQRTKKEECAAVEAGLRSLQMQFGQLSARLEQAARDRELLKTRRQEQAEAKAERSLYKHLRAAFGRHGIPSLIIEQTLPEIEDRANTLLDRLTDGKMHVKLETLKDKKTGGTRETLEIIITDEQGVPRPYETFSGGEAFRVNFALRISLAQLLAERSGVRIRTLVVDEGFGTQDAQGVQSMVEAIQTIQQDFDKIIVITHLDQLKEAFPVRIEVEKDPVEGSSFEILGV